MNADFERIKHRELTEKTIGSFYTVYNVLGYGFLEKVYEHAMMIELRRQSLYAERQHAIEVSYEGEIVGEYFADILVEKRVIVEIKASKKLAKENEAQLLNYLKATGIEVELLLNFGPKPEIMRRIFDNR